MHAPGALGVPCVAHANNRGALNHTASATAATRLSCATDRAATSMFWRFGNYETWALVRAHCVKKPRAASDKRSL